MTSSVDPTLEMASILQRLRSLPATCYNGVPQGAVLALDGFGDVLPYRDFQPGSVIPDANQRLIAAHEQSQPHVWAFQVTHVAPTRSAAVALSIETDRVLIGWTPPSGNAGPIKTFYFVVYDEFNKSGDRVEWLATRFYQTVLGQAPDMNNPSVLF